MKRYGRTEDAEEEDAYYGRNVRPRYGDDTDVGGRVAADRFLRAGPYERDFQWSEEDLKKAAEVKLTREPIVPRSAFQGTIKSHGRGPPVMQQAMVVSTVRMNKDEASRRARTPPEQMLVPNSLSPGMKSVFMGMPGDLLFELCDSKTAADRRKLGSYGSREVFVAVNGLCRDAQVRFVGVMSAKVSDPNDAATDDAHNSENAGSSTIVHTGPEEVFAGDDLFADILPYYKMGPGDRPVSVVQARGQPVEKLVPAIYALRNSDIEASLADARDIIDSICKDGKNNTWAKRWTAATNRFSEIEARYGSTQSLRNYGLLYLVLRAVDTQPAGDEIKDIQAVIQEDLRNTSVSDHQQFFGAAVGDPDDVLFDAAFNGHGGEIYEVMQRCLQRAQDAFRDRLRRMRIGKCIKGGKPGAALDLILGVYSSP